MCVYAPAHANVVLLQKKNKQTNKRSKYSKYASTNFHTLFFTAMLTIALNKLANYNSYAVAIIAQFSSTTISSNKSIHSLIMNKFNTKIKIKPFLHVNIMLREKYHLRCFRDKKVLLWHHNSFHVALSGKCIFACFVFHKNNYH